MRTRAQTHMHNQTTISSEKMSDAFDFVPEKVLCFFNVYVYFLEEEKTFTEKSSFLILQYKFTVSSISSLFLIQYIYTSVSDGSFFTHHSSQPIVYQQCHVPCLCNCGFSSPKRKNK